ncbi:MAG: hypothetical protein R3A79_10060 [Nannocystaceae bacterium]
MRSLLPAALLCCGLVACNGDAGESETNSLDLRDDAVENSEAASIADDELANVDDEDADEAAAVVDADAGADEAAAAADDSDFEFAPHSCVHSVDERRPRITKSSQERTKLVIRHVAKRLGLHNDFRKFLALIALRESSYQAGLVHRLSPDLNASYVSWRKMSTRYEDNPFADDPTLWQTYGLFGMNSNYFTLLWDKSADPRVLCDPIVDVLLYRRAAVRALRKINSGAIRCKDASGESFDITLEPTWFNIHRAVSGGKICPSKHEDRAATMRKYFVARATRSGFDPDGVVTMKMLGKEPTESEEGDAWDDQERMVMGLWEEIEAIENEEAEKLRAREEAKAARKAKRQRGGDDDE